MSRFGGLGNLGGFGDIQKMAKQVQTMQADAAKLQEEMANARIEAQAGGGMVTATVNGTGHLVALKINPAAVDASDVELLEDLILTATKDAAAKALAEQEEKMSDIAGAFGDLKLPPGLF